MFFKKNIKIPVEISARHCHLSKSDFEKLFGQGAELKKIRQLSQPSDFSAEQTVDILVGSKKFESVRVVGPLRERSQVEISLTDAVGSGVVPPVALSGQLEKSSPVVITGSAGTVELAEGLIVALRHIHCATKQAAKLGLKDGMAVSVRVEGQRPVVFEKVPVRVKDGYELCMHLDTDEGNAAGINKIGEGIILK
jgi:putative phosphotransacetylase